MLRVADDTTPRIGSAARRASRALQHTAFRSHPPQPHLSAMRHLLQSGPIGAARVGYKDGAYLLNPGYEELGSSALNMTVAGTKSAVLMVESAAVTLRMRWLLVSAI